VDDFTIIGKDLFKKETRMDRFVGLKVQLSTGAILSDTKVFLHSTGKNKKQTNKQSNNQTNR